MPMSLDQAVGEIKGDAGTSLLLELKQDWAGSTHHHRCLLLRRPVMHASPSPPPVSNAQHLVGIGAEFTDARKGAEGVVIQKLHAGGAGFLSGLLREGDVVLAVNGTTVSNSKTIDRMMLGPPFSRLVTLKPDSETLDPNFKG